MLTSVIFVTPSTAISASQRSICLHSAVICNPKVKQMVSQNHYWTLQCGKACSIPRAVYWSCYHLGWHDLDEVLTLAKQESTSTEELECLTREVTWTTCNQQHKRHGELKKQMHFPHSSDEVNTLPGRWDVKTMLTSFSISRAFSMRRMHSSRKVCSQNMTACSNHIW